MGLIKKIECQECGTELKIEEMRLDMYDDIRMSVVPCETCEEQRKNDIDEAYRCYDELEKEVEKERELHQGLREQVEILEDENDELRETIALLEE